MGQGNDNRKAVITGVVVLVIALLIWWFLHDAEQDRINALETEAAKYLQALTDEREQSRESEAGLQTKIEELAAERATLQAGLANSQTDNSRIETLSREVADLQAALDAAQVDNARLETLTRDVDDLQSALDAAQADNARLEVLIREVADLQAALDATQADKSRIEANMHEELARMQLSTAELQQELQQRQSTQASLNQSLQQVSNEKSELAARLAAEREAQRQLQQQITAVADDIDEKETALKGAGFAALRLKYQLARKQQEQRQLQANLEQLNREREAEAEHFAELQRRLQRELNESRVQISQLKNRMTVIKLTSEVLFASGSANIKPAGRKVLALIAESLNSYPDRQIGIEGHTDTVPVGKNSRFASNWELSAARALSAVNFLQQHNQVDPSRLKIVGYGEHQPVASNDTAAGRQLNRRIEIRVLPPGEE